MKIDDVISKLKQIRSNLENYDYADLTFMLNELVPNITASVADFKNISPEKVFHDFMDHRTFYRARPHNDINTSVSFPELNEISYIQAYDLTKIKEYGRANKPQQSIFYCSTEIHTACMEGLSKGIDLDNLSKVQEKWLTVGLWKLKEDLKLAEIIATPKILKELKNGAPGIAISSKDIMCAEKHFNETKQKIGDEYQIKILEFFSEEFLRTKINTNKDYMICNYYADRVMNRIDGYNIESVDGIIYPSVPSGYKFKNIALEPDCVDEKLEFLGAKKVRYIRYPDGRFILDVKQGSVGVKADENGRIQWKVL